MCSTSLSSAIFNAIQNFTVPLEHPYFKNPTLCTYYYYRGVDLLHDKAFVRAHRALQASYDLCHPALLNHRRKILIPLLATSIIVGRFPSEELIRRPEAEGLRELFFPVCRAISKGDFRAFRVAMGIEGPDKWKAEWWEQHRLHRLLEDRTNVLIWRSLIRKVYLITAQPDQKQPIVKIDDLWACAVALHRKAPEDINHDELRMLQENPHVDPWSVSDPTTWWSGGIRLGKDQVEGVVMSLLDQRLVRGYMARQPAGMSTRLVLGKADPVPSVWGVCLQQSPEEPKAEQPVGGGGGRVVRLSGVKAIGE